MEHGDTSMQPRGDEKTANMPNAIEISHEDVVGTPVRIPLSKPTNLSNINTTDDVMGENERSLDSVVEVSVSTERKPLPKTPKTSSSKPTDVLKVILRRRGKVWMSSKLTTLPLLLNLMSITKAKVH